MAYINYAQINANRASNRSSAVTIIKKDIEHIPWAEMYRIYTKAGDDWEETAQAAHEHSENEKYEYSIRKREENWSEMHSEEGAYEGNLRDEFPKPPLAPLPSRNHGRLKAGQKALTAYITGTLKLGSWADTVMPQIITRLGNMPVVYNAEGLINGTQFVKDNFKTEADRGFYHFLMLDSRSCYLDSPQYKGTSKSYSALVPLILYALRLVKDIPYTAWDRETLRHVVNYDLYRAMTYTTDSWPTREQILEDREIGLTYHSGSSMGKVRNPISSHKLYSTKNTCFDKMPSLVQVMIAQIWVAHPENRTKYMILDCENWHRVPPALVSTEVFSPELNLVYQTAGDLPWDA